MDNSDSWRSSVQHVLVETNPGSVPLHAGGGQCDNYTLKSNKYVCITTHQPDTKSNPNSNPNPDPTTKQHAAVNNQLNTV